MAMYRCAVCGSANVERKSSRLYICQDCEARLNHAMPEDLKLAIDMCLINEEFRSKLTLQGHPINWKYIRSTYKNIEEGFADRISGMNARFDAENLLSYATATVEEFEESIETILHFQKNIKSNYSDEKPMTLAEYYVWQNAITVFIENAAKYYESNPKYHYVSTGINQKDLCKLFMVYLFEKIRLESGDYPEFVIEDKHHNICEDFAHYASNNPFVVLFAKKFFKVKTIKLYTHEEGPYSWDAKMFGRIFAKDLVEDIDGDYFVMEDTFCEYGNLSSNAPGNICRNFWLSGVTYQDINMLHFFPRYLVKDGKLYYTQYTHNNKKPQNILQDLTEYFKAYPEKEAIYNNRIANIEKLKAKIKANEEEASRLEEQIDANIDKKHAINKDITKLSKKIFGKKKAQERIEELNAELKSVEDEIKVLSARMDEIEKENKKSTPEEEYRYLAYSMDYFLILHPCEPDNDD